MHSSKLPIYNVTKPSIVPINYSMSQAFESWFAPGGNAAHMWSTHLHFSLSPFLETSPTTWVRGVADIPATLRTSRGCFQQRNTRQPSRSTISNKNSSFGLCSLRPCSILLSTGTISTIRPVPLPTPATRSDMRSLRSIFGWVTIMQVLGGKSVLLTRLQGLLASGGIVGFVDDQATVGIWVLGVVGCDGYVGLTAFDSCWQVSNFAANTVPMCSNHVGRESIKPAICAVSSHPRSISPTTTTTHLFK